MGITLSAPQFKQDDHKTWPPLLPLYAVAKILCLSPWTLRQWDKQGKLIAVRIGDRKDRRYKKEDIVKILQFGLVKVVQKV